MSPAVGRDPFAVLGLPPHADEFAVRAAWRRLARSAHPDAGGSHHEMQALNVALDSALSMIAARHDTSRAHPGAGRHVRDMSSFTVDVLPVETYAALEVVAAELGSMITDDPPYMIEFTLHQSSLDEGGQAWCRCDLVPEEGATTVHVTVGSDGDWPVPSVESARNLLVSALNTIDWPG